MTKFFNEKERSRLNASKEESGTGLPEMTKEEIRLTCLENDGYDSPELNDKLYLHFRGFKRIENLEEYTACKALWLDSNGIDTIENLEALVELRCLYLGKNLISNVSGLSTLQHLSTIDLSYNRITMVMGLSSCPNLQSVNLSRNALTDAASIAHLADCPALQSLDLTHNRLAGEEILGVLASIPKLANLSVNGNDLAKLPSFRKRLVFKCGRKLGYLDRPVDEVEHVAATAFAEGGIEAERAAKQAFRDAERAKKLDESAAFRQWQEQQREQRKADLAAGKVFYKQMTVAETEARKEEAERAHAAEMRLLDAGVANVAKKFHQMDTGSGDVNALLDNAVEAALRGDTVVGNALPADAEQEEEDIIAERNNSNPNPAVLAQQQKEMEEEAARRKAAAEAEAAAVAAAAPAPPAPPTPEEEALALAQQEAKRQELEQQQLVQDSLAMYNQLRQGGADAVARAETARSHTWSRGGSVGVSAGAITESGEGAVERPLYWSEAMDIELARQVKACVFDFAAISTELQNLCKGGHFGLESMHLAPRLTSDECRLHWAKLDASQWCEEAPDTSALHTNFKINVQPSNLPGGVQPSFDDIARMAKSQAPAYLKVPSAFPSVADVSDEEEEEENVAPMDLRAVRMPITVDDDLDAMD